MALVTDTKFRLTNAPGLEGLEFTPTSPGAINQLEAVMYAKGHDAILVSIREHAGFRTHAQGANEANKYHNNRTALIGGVDSRGYFLAFADDPDISILLTRTEEAVAAHAQGKQWLLPYSDAGIEAMLIRAASQQRKVNPPSQRELKLSTKTDGNTSAFGSYRAVRAMLGDQAEPYARFLNEQGINEGRLILPTEEELEQRGVTTSTAIVIPVRLGGNVVGLSNVIADDGFYGGSRALGVRGAAGADALSWK